MSKASIAVIGAGLIGREHMRFLQASNSADLVAVADANPAAAIVAAEAGVPFYEDYRRLLDEMRPEGVIAAVPNHLHLEAALAAIERGITVLIEKPIAPTIAEARQIEDASVASGIQVLVGHHRRHSPDMVAGRELIASGGLGRVLSANGMLYNRKNDEYFDTDWRTSPGTGGPILINLIHELDCLRYVVGEIDTVTALVSHAGRELAVEDTVSALIRFEGGAIGSFALSDAIPSPWVWDSASGQGPYYPYQPGSCYWVGGTTGSLALPSMEWWHNRPGEDWRHPLLREYVPIDHSGCYDNQIDHFVRMIRDGEPSRCDANEGLKTLAATLAVQRSADEGRPVAVAELLADNASDLVGGSR